MGIGEPKHFKVNSIISFIWCARKRNMRHNFCFFTSINFTSLHNFKIDIFYLLLVLCVSYFAIIKVIFKKGSVSLFALQNCKLKSENICTTEIRWIHFNSFFVLKCLNLIIPNYTCISNLFETSIQKKSVSAKCKKKKWRYK